MNRLYRNVSKLLRAGWKINKKYYFVLILNVMFSLVFALTMIRVPAIVLDMVQQQSMDFKTLVILFGLLAVSALMSALCKVWYTPTGIQVRYHYLLQVMKQNISIPYEEYQKTNNQQNTWNIYRGVTSIDGIQAFFEHLGMLSGNFSIVLLSLGVILRLNVWAALLTLIWFVVYTSLSIWASNQNQLSFQKNIHLFQESWYVLDVGIDVSYGKEIRVFQIKDWISQKIQNVNCKLQAIAAKNEVRVMRVGLLDDGYQFLRDGIVYGFLILSFYQQHIGLAQFASFSVLLMQLNRALTNSSNHVKAILSHHEKYEMMFDYLTLEQPPQEELKIDAVIPWEITFQNVDFKYPNTERYIFRNLNFKITKNEKIAIVGLNGAGKTTLLLLLMRLYRPTSGTITLNGTDIQKYDFHSYITLFSPVFQEINVFPFTIKENLVFDRVVDEAILLEALRNAGLHEDTVSKEQLHNQELTRFLNPAGRVLSGGQSQKLTTARAYAYQRPILILDEPTSALDSQAEHEFYENIHDTMDEKTILFVSHRLASTQFCDDILLIEGENILEQGSHHELMSKQGRYYELFQVQAKYYKEGTIDEEKI